MTLKLALMGSMELQLTSATMIYTPLATSNRNSMFLDDLDPKVTEGSKGPFVILVKITYNMGV